MKSIPRKESVLRNILIIISLLVQPACLSEKTVLLPISMDIEKLNPAQVLSLESKTILSTVFSGLFEIRGTKTTPKLVDTWSFNPIDKIYFLNLKKGVLFHDGSNLTSDDVIFSIHQWAKPRALDSHLLQEIEGIRAYQNGTTPKIAGVSRTGEFSLTIRVINSNVDLPSMLALPRFVIVRSNFGGQTEEQYYKHPVGTGPFAVKNYLPNKLELIRNPKYFLEKSRAPSMVISKMSYDEALLKFNKKELDVLIFYSIPDVSRVTRKDVVVEVLPQVTTTALIFPQNVRDLQVLMTRKKITNFIKKSEFIQKCTSHSDSETPFLPPGFLTVVDPTEHQKKTSTANESIKTEIEIFLTDDIWARCTSANSPITDGLATYKTAEINELFSLFKAAKLGPFVEDLTFKNDDPMTVLQYFEPGTPEYLLAKPIPELTKLFTQINQSVSRAEKNAYINRVFDFLAENYLAVPLGHPKNIRLYSELILGVSQYSIFRQSQNWEELGY